MRGAEGRGKVFVCNRRLDFATIRAIRTADAGGPGDCPADSTAFFSEADLYASWRACHLFPVVMAGRQEATL